MSLGRKQTSSNEHFVEVAANIEKYVSRVHAFRKVEQAVERIKLTQLDDAAYAWSGGKDSIALQVVCQQAGIKRCVLAITRLEYPAFLEWVTNNMPEGLTVINTGQDLDWLRSNLHMLFPQDAQTAAKWFSAVQHKAQDQYFKQEKLSKIFLGRRRADGNYIGKPGEFSYYKNGILRISPIWDWTHEEVIAVNHYFSMPVPPIYAWPNGFIVGTGSWAARQYTGSIENGWKQVYSIDPSVVRYAATKLASAESFLATVESS